MGFLAGATGGITLTLSLTYLALATHARNRQNQSDILRSSTGVLNSLASDPSLPRRHPSPTTDALYPPSRAELAARKQQDFIETAKSRWNAEIENAVRWAQNQDWTSVREDAGERVIGMAKRVDVHEVEEQVKAGARSAGEKVKGVAKGVAKEVRQDVAKGIEKGREMVGRAKAAVYLAEERAEAKMDARLLHVSEIERVLNQRYQRDESVMKKSVKEVLAERYTPIDQRDNTKLRGI